MDVQERVSKRLLKAALGRMPPRGYRCVRKNLHVRETIVIKNSDFPMYAKLLRNAAHTRRFTIRNVETDGWQVIDERDSVVVKCTHYHDWHRVERAKAAFAIEATMLTESGWVEA